MSKYTKKLKLNLIFMFIALNVVIILSLNIYTKFSLNKMEHYLLTEDVVITHEGRKDYKGSIRDYKLYDEHNDDFYTLYMTIPKNTLKRPILFFDNVNNGLNIYVNNKKIYTIGMDAKKGSTICQANTKIPLPDIKEGDIIKMEIRALSHSTFRGMPTCFLYNAYECDTYFLIENINHQFIIALSFVLFMIGILICIFCGLKEDVLKKLLVVSLLCAMSGIHSLSAYKLIQPACDCFVLDVYLELCSRSLIVSLIGLYLYYDAPKKQKYHLIVPIGSTLHIIIVAIMQLTKTGYIYDTLNMLLAISIILIFDLINTSVHKLRKNKAKYRKLIFVSLLLILSLAVLIIILTSSSSKYLIEMFNLLPIVIMSIICILYITLLEQVYNTYKAAAEKEALTQLAYIDKLTGLQNRHYIETHIKPMLVNLEQSFALYMFDLNSLKKINDTYGHAEGDNAIKTFAKCLRNTFFDAFCIRLGGDEFIAIIENSTFNNELINKLNDQINEVNKSLEYKVAFSYGIETFEGSDIYNIDDILDKADSKMYKNKSKIYS